MDTKLDTSALLAFEQDPIRQVCWRRKSFVSLAIAEKLPVCTDYFATSSVGIPLSVSSDNGLPK